jgi:uncharacterized membrane protein YjfL (UPF0719 family)
VKIGMNDNFQMSPMARVLVNVLRIASWGAAGLLVLFGAILIYQRVTPDGGLALARDDYAFLGVLVALLALALYIARAIRKEMDNPGGK